MTDIIEDVIDYIKDKKISVKLFSNITIIIIDLVDSISDIWKTWKAKDEKLLNKILCTISTIVFFIIGIRIWL